LENKWRNGREDMSALINAKGLGCAQPVVLAKNALELYDEVTIVVDERMVLENLKLLGMHIGSLGMHVRCLTDVTGEPGDIYWIHLKKKKLDRNIASVLRADEIY
jgi:hypothetical protein